MAKTRKRSGPEKTAKKSNSSMNPGKQALVTIIVRVFNISLAFKPVRQVHVAHLNIEKSLQPFHVIDSKFAS